MNTQDTQQTAVNRRIAFTTLGCKLNQYETESLATRFADAGYRIVPFNEAADAYIVNTCTVTNKADRKTRNTINRAVRASEDLVVVTGCFASTGREELERNSSLLVVENEHKNHVFEMVEAHFNDEIFDRNAVPGDVFAFPVADRVFHTRGMVKIQDGCDNFCAFCIIPYVRGTARSRPHREILNDVSETIARGTKEIVVTGVNMSRYHDGTLGFADLIERIVELPGEFRVRVSSLEPDHITDRFIELLDHPKLCSHLHLCLQSGSERILLAMRRQYTYSGYRAIVEKIRTAQPLFNITTDIIVGFPGETEAEFSETCAAIHEIGFSHIHTFPYSRRSGTRADRMPAHVAEKIKSERGEVIRNLGAELKTRYRTRLIGTRQTLLVEKARNGEASGYGESYSPLRLIAAPSGHEPAVNEFIDVTITTITSGDEPELIAVPTEPRVCRPQILEA